MPDLEPVVTLIRALPLFSPPSHCHTHRAHATILLAWMNSCQTTNINDHLASHYIEPSLGTIPHNRLFRIM
jgi:hypothetical protein